MPVHESQDSIDDMVRTHISMKSRDGGCVIDGRDSFSEEHMGKGMSSLSGGYAGKGQITSVNQLGMFGVGSVGTVEHTRSSFFEGRGTAFKSAKWFQTALGAKALTSLLILHSIWYLDSQAIHRSFNYFAYFLTQQQPESNTLFAFRF